MSLIGIQDSDWNPGDQPCGQTTWGKRDNREEVEEEETAGWARAKQSSSYPPFLPIANCSFAEKWLWKLKPMWAPATRLHLPLMKHSCLPCVMIPACLLRSKSYCVQYSLPQISMHKSLQHNSMPVYLDVTTHCVQCVHAVLSKNSIGWGKEIIHIYSFKITTSHPLWNLSYPKQYSTKASYK